MLLPITLTIAAAAALINIWIAYRVGQVRRSAKIAHGDGGEWALIARMRAHANFVEYTPFFLILLGLIELAIGPRLWLWIAGILFILARIAHAFGMDAKKPGLPRAIGTGVTLLVLAGLAGYAIYLAYTQAVVSTARADATTIKA